MQTRKGIAIAAVALTLAIVGCSSASPTQTPGATQTPGQTAGQTAAQTAAAQSPAGTKVTSINYWYWQDDTTDPTIKNLAAQFEQLTGIHVNIQDSISQPNFYQSLVNAIAAGNAPDATHLNTNMFGQLIQANVLEPLNTQVDAWSGKADVIPSMWKFVTGPDGKTIYAMPNKFLMFYMYYRTDLFKAAGIEVPKTQADFVAAAKTLTIPSKNQYGFDIRGGANGQDQWAAFLIAGGGQFLDSSGGVAFNSAAAKASNDLYISTYPYAPPGAINDGYAQITSNFEAGHAAMIINHLGLAKTLDKWNSANTGVALIPSTTGDPTKTTYMGTMNANAVLAASDKKAAAFAWISFLAQTQAQLAITLSTNGYLPVVQSVASDKQFATNKYMQISIQAAAGNVAAWPAVPGTTVATQKTWQPLFQGALLGKNSNDAVVEGVATTLAQK
jgi:multiple sugar transport system substrate-binding protein